MASNFNTYSLYGSPCYSKETGDCENRKAGCAVTCEKWKQYELHREKIRNNRINDLEARRMYLEQIQKRKKIRGNWPYTKER